MFGKIMERDREDGSSKQDPDEGIDDSKKSSNFKEFEDLCCRAYNILRSEGHKIINMFLIMLSAGMPELSKEADIDFLV